MTVENIAQGSVSPVTETERATFLRRVLRADGVFSGLSGLTMIVAAGPLAAFLGLTAPWVLTAIGVMLLVYAADLWYIAVQTPVSRRLTIATITADVLWVVASWGILLAGWPELSTAGKWTVAIIADIVMVVAILKYIGLRRL